jgi:putative DNA methylase
MKSQNLTKAYMAKKMNTSRVAIDNILDPNFNTLYSAHNAEVQHNNPVVFSRLLANVFFECYRVLKDDGVLAFSFHHSKPEGWAAIYQSIILAGFRLVNFYPVHGELTAASPKYAANSPISIDTLLICKKDNFISDNALKYKYYTLDKYIHDFSENDFTLSENDKFVIETALLLVQLNGLKLSYEEICEYLINKGLVNSTVYEDGHIASNDAVMINN